MQWPSWASTHNQRETRLPIRCRLRSVNPGPAHQRRQAGGVGPEPDSVNRMSAQKPSPMDRAQVLVGALAAVFFGIALCFGDVTLPRSVLGGSIFILAGVCWAIAAVMDFQKRRRRVSQRA